VQLNRTKEEVDWMNTEFLAILFLGIALVSLIVGIVLCFLAILGYNTYLKIQNEQKKIEVRAKNSNQNN